MHLQNRVTPYGDLIATPARGMLLGNRGGRFHRDDRKLGARRWASSQWICCVLAFKGRHRAVWGKGYTELFFLDEPTAFAAGHRPCFECRRADAAAFASTWIEGDGVPPRAGEMDRVLDAERRHGRAKRLHRRPINGLPDGTFVVAPADPALALAIRGARLLRWTPSGYNGTFARPPGLAVDVLTPPATIRALAAGYRPLWHPSADPP